MKKVFMIVMILFVVLLTSYSQVFASFTDPITDPSSYKPAANSSSNNTKLIERGNIVLGVIRFAGTFISVIILMVLGIKYMVGSIEEKANYKEAMGPYLIGAVMLFTIPNIIGILYDLVVNNIK